MEDCDSFFKNYDLGERIPDPATRAKASEDPSYAIPRKPFKDEESLEDKRSRPEVFKSRDEINASKTKTPKKPPKQKEGPAEASPSLSTPNLEGKSKQEERRVLPEALPIPPVKTPLTITGAVPKHDTDKPPAPVEIVEKVNEKEDHEEVFETEEMDQTEPESKEDNEEEQDTPKSPDLTDKLSFPPLTAIIPRQSQDSRKSTTPDPTSPKQANPVVQPKIDAPADRDISENVTENNATYGIPATSSHTKEGNPSSGMAEGENELHTGTDTIKDTGTAKSSENQEDSSENDSEENLETDLKETALADKQLTPETKTAAATARSTRKIKLQEAKTLEEARNTPLKDNAIELEVESESEETQPTREGTKLAPMFVQKISQLKPPATSSKRIKSQRIQK